MRKKIRSYFSYCVGIAIIIIGLGILAGLCGVFQAGWEKSYRLFQKLDWVREIKI